MKDIVHCKTENEWEQKLEELDDPIVIPTNATLIDYPGSLYEELDGIPEVTRLYWVTQLGLARYCTGTLSATHTRYGHSIIFATKVDKIAQELGLDRELAVSAAMLHDIASTPFSDSVSKAAGVGDEAYFGRVLQGSSQAKKFLKKYKISEESLSNLVKGSDTSPLGQLINSRDSIDVDRWSYVTEDARQMGESPDIWYGRYDADPFDSVAIHDGRIVFQDLKSVRQFLEARVQMYEKIYKHEQLMAKEAFLPYLFENMKKHVDLGPEHLLKMSDSEFMQLGHEHGGELGRRLFRFDGFKFYGFLDGGEQEVLQYMRKLTDRPIAVSRQKAMNPATGVPILDDQKVRTYAELEPRHAGILKARMSAWSNTAVYGFDDDHRARSAYSQALRRFGGAYTSWFS